MISGTITNSFPTPRPVTDGIVTACTNTGCDGGLRATGDVLADGTYSIPVLNGTYHLVYSGSYPEQAFPADVTVNGADVPRQDLAFSLGQISGTAHDGQSVGIHNVTVNVYPDPSAPPTNSTTTAADGSYALWVTAPGSYYVQFIPPYATTTQNWYPDQSDAGTATPVDVTAGDKPNIDATFVTAGLISGTIRTVTGAPPLPIKGKVTVWTDPTCTTPATTAATESDSLTGAYQVWVDAGAYYIGASEINLLVPNATTRYYDVTTPGGALVCSAPAAVRGGMTGVDFALPLYRVSGHVTAGGPAVPNAFVSSNQSPFDSTSTDASGLYALTSEALTITVTAFPSDQRQAPMSQTLVVSANTTLDFALVSQWQITGTVRRSSDLQVVSNAYVTAYIADGVSFDQAGVNVYGQYTLWLPTGTYRIAASAPGFADEYNVSGLTFATGTDIPVKDANLGPYDFELPPSLSATPNVGAAGATITLSGSGFLPSTAVTLAFDGVAQTIAATTTSASGTISALSFTVPLTAASGQHTITVTAGATGTTYYTVP